MIVACSGYNDLQKACNVPKAFRKEEKCLDCPARDGDTAKKVTPASTAPTASKTATTPPPPMAQNNPVSAHDEKCPNCAMLSAELDNVYAQLDKYRVFIDAQKGKRQQSRKVSKLIENAHTVRSLKEIRISNKKIAQMFGVSDATIRRLIKGELA